MLGDQSFKVAAAPADHPVRYRVWPRLDNPVEFSQLILVQKRLAARALPVAQPLHAFGIIAMNPIGQALPVHARKPRSLAPGRSLQDQGKRQQATGLLRIADAACLAPQLLRR